MDIKQILQILDTARTSFKVGDKITLSESQLIETKLGIMKHPDTGVQIAWVRHPFEEDGKQSTIDMIIEPSEDEFIIHRIGGSRDIAEYWAELKSKNDAISGSISESSKKHNTDNKNDESNPTVYRDPEIIDFMHHLDAYYPSAAGDETLTFEKFVLRSLEHSKKDDNQLKQEVKSIKETIASNTSQNDNKISDLRKEINQLWATIQKISA